MSKKVKATAATQKAKPAAAPAPVKNNQVLSSKDQTHWKRVLKHYERKEYKKVLKAADQILANNPMHGETLAMKGLTLNCLKKKDEARKLVKMGVAMNLKSHVCWHVYGLLYRSDHMYDDAIKCYQNALQHDKDNQQILKDLANLQIQRRELTGFQETRRKLLLLKKNNRSNWIAYAIGAHLCGQHNKALKILESYMKTQKDEPVDRTSKYEISEISVYRNVILLESGKPEEALLHLSEIESKVVDKIYLHERKGELLLQLGKASVAEEQYRALLRINPENWTYHYGIMQSVGLASKDTLTKGSFDGLNDEARGKLVTLYAELGKEFPKVSAVERIPLNFLAGSQFASAVDKYMRVRIQKGIPSLFRDLINLYSNAEKTKIITDLVTSYVPHLRSDLRFSSTEEKGSESPLALVWALFLAANHHDFLAEYSQALTAINEALEHTPTNIDLYVLKARILKHVGDAELAHEFMDEARKLDTADRYLNTKCVRYALRADKVQKANEVVVLFLRDGDSLASLYDMQCSWYELQCGHSYVRQKDWGRALKQYTNVIKHFQDMEDDQFDFHLYCLKKMTLRAYVGMIRMEDKIRSHRFFFRASRGAVQTYVDMYDSRKPDISDEQTANEENLSEEDKKKAAKKAKRDAAKVARAAEAAKVAAAEQEKAAKNTQDKKTTNRNKEVDNDPHGEELAKTTDPLKDACKHLNDLLSYSVECIETHILAMEVYSRKNKPLLVLRSLIKALSIDRSHPIVHLHHVSLLRKVEEAKEKLHPTVMQVIQLEREAGSVGGGQASLAALNDTYLKQCGSSVAARMAVARSAVRIGTPGKEAFFFTGDFPLEKATVVECCALLTELEKQKLEVAAWKARCLERFPFTPAFMGPEALANHREKEKIKEPI